MFVGISRHMFVLIRVETTPHKFYVSVWCVYTAIDLVEFTADFYGVEILHSFSHITLIQSYFVNGISWRKEITPKYIFVIIAPLIEIVTMCMILYTYYLQNWLQGKQLKGSTKDLSRKELWRIRKKIEQDWFILLLIHWFKISEDTDSCRMTNF